MKKWIAIPAVFFTVMIVFIGMLVFRDVRYHRYLTEIRYHSMRMQIETEPITGTTLEDGEIELDGNNVNGFMDAVTRSGTSYQILKPRGFVEETAVTMKFPDGAVYTVYEAGKDKNGKDHAVIRYQYDGRDWWLTVNGYMTWKRTHACCSAAGYMVPNVEE